MKKRRIYWKIIFSLAIILVVITFTPLVINKGKIEPKLLSMPYTLWISILITIGLVVLTYIGGKVHLQNNEERKKTDVDV